MHDYYINAFQGRTQNLMWVGSFQEKVDLFDGAGVQSTPSMRSMLKLGGSGGMPPQENLKNRYQNTGFGDISAADVQRIKIFLKMNFLSIIN